MQAECPCRGRDIAVVFGQHALQVFPFQALGVQWAIRGRRQLVLGGVAVVRPEQGAHHVVGADRLGPVVGRAALDRLDRGGDRGEAREQQDRYVRLPLAQGFDQAEAIVLAQLEVEHDACEWFAGEV
jgi:hypothetical protein